MIISEWYLCKYGFRGESINERLLLDPEYGGDPLHVGMVGDVGCVQVVHHFPLVLDVPHVQQRSQNLATENINTRWHWYISFESSRFLETVIRAQVVLDQIVYIESMVLP